MFVLYRRESWANLEKTFVENMRNFGIALKTVNIIKVREIGGDCAFASEIRHLFRIFTKQKTTQAFHTK